MSNLTESEHKELLVLLHKYDFKKVFEKMREYLDRVGKQPYIVLVTGLVKIDILHQDFEYPTAIEYLDKLLGKDYRFDVNYFKKKVQAARNNPDKREYEFLKEILENAASLDLDVYEKYDLYEYIETEIIEKEEEKDPVRRSAKRLVEQEHERLLDGEGMVLLDSRFTDKKDAIMDVCESYADIRAFTVHDHKQRERIVLRYKDPLFAMVDFPSKVKEGKQAIKDKDYKKAEEIFLFLLCHGKPRFNIYKSLALVYAGLGEYRKSLDFFTVTESLARDEGMNPKCAEIRNFVLEQYINSEKPGTRILEMINESCKDEGISYNELLEGLVYAKVDMNTGSLLQLALYEIDTFRKVIEVARKSLECKRQGIPYERFSKPPKNRHVSFKRMITELRSETTEKKQERYDNFKPFVNLKTKEFTPESDANLYGIANFDELDAFIQESGLDVETAAEEYGFTPEQINIIRLIYAREYFMQGYYDKGDEFIKAVEQAGGKDQLVKNILSKIRAQKAFYKNRGTDNPRVLSLTLKPKKKN